MSLIPSVSLCVCLSVCQSKKCTVAIRLTGSGCRFRWGVGSVKGWLVIKREGAVLVVNMDHPIETNGDFVALCESDTLFPNYFGRTCLLSLQVFFCSCLPLKLRPPYGTIEMSLLSLFPDLFLTVALCRYWW